MTRKLIVKKEIRTLGLDLCNPQHLVGAIVRGGVYMDGVEVFPSNLTNKFVARPYTRRTCFAVLSEMRVHAITRQEREEGVHGLRKVRLHEQPRRQAGQQAGPRERENRRHRPRRTEDTDPSEDQG